MKITRLLCRGALTPLCLAALLAACGDGRQPDKNTRSDTAVATKRTPEHPQVVPGATDSGTGLTSPGQHTHPEQSPAAPLTEPQIVAWLAQIHELEMTQGNLAESQATSADVKSFAKKLSDDHRTLGGRTKKLGAEMGIAPVEAPHEKSDDAIAQSIEALKAAPAASFDSLFIAHQIDAHRTLLGRLKELRALAKHPALQKALDGTGKKLEEHLEQAEKVQAKLGT